MPQLLPQLLKAQLLAFLVQNADDPDDEWKAKSKEELVVIVRQLLEGAGIPPDSYDFVTNCLLYTSPSPRDKRQSRMPSSA